jgi:hypothetical protein
MFCSETCELGEGGGGGNLILRSVTEAEFCAPTVQKKRRITQERRCQGKERKWSLDLEEEEERRDRGGGGEGEGKL